MSAISVIKQGVSTKEQMTNFVEQVVEDFLSGQFDKLESFKEITLLSRALDKILKSEKVKESVLKEAEKQGKTFKYSGVEFQVCEAGVEWDYSNCQDATWNELQEDIDRLTEKRKAREKELQARTNTKELLASSETGEILLPPVRTSQTIVKIKL